MISHLYMWSFNLVSTFCIQLIYFMRLSLTSTNNVKYRYMKHERWIMKTKWGFSWYPRVADGSCKLHVTGRRRYQISLEGASSSSSQRRAPFLHSRWQGRSSREIVYPGKVIYICNHLLHSVNYYKTLTSQLWLLHDLGSGTDNKHFSDTEASSLASTETRECQQ